MLLDVKPQVDRVSVPPSGAPSSSPMRYTKRGPGKKVEKPEQEPLVYMPTVPATAEEAMGKVPLAPDCAEMRLIVRQSGWDEVDVADGVGRDEDVGDGVGVRVAVVLGVIVAVEDSVFVAVGEGDEERLRMLAMLRPR